MRIGPVSRIAVLLLVAVALTGCGGSEPSPAPPSTPSAPTPQAEQPRTDDPCALITDSEAEAALGKASEPPTRDGAEPNACNWFPEGIGDALTVVRAEIVSGGREAYEAEKQARGGAERVTGIGEDAYAVEDADSLRVVAVEGEKVVEVTAPEAEDAQELARKALSRL